MKGKWVEAPGGEHMHYHCKNPECGAYLRSVFLLDGGVLECHACHGEVEEVDVRTLVEKVADLTASALRKIMQAGKVAEQQWMRLQNAKSHAIAHRLGKADFTPKELVYAAWQRCSKCDCGFAYPKEIGPRGAWYCSTLLTDSAADPKDHDDAYPFTFFDIKSENQPSANGATTRPSNKPLA